jgi:hypothetical protein
MEATMSRLDMLKKRQVNLKDDISAMLDSFLIGSIARSPSMSSHCLTTKVEGKTATWSVKKTILPKAMEMSNRYKTIWKLMQTLSKVNWEILKLEDK